MPKRENYASQEWRRVLNARKAVIGTVDTGLEFYRRVLDLRGYRQQVLTADISNASTPGFKAVDLDFQEALNALAAEPSASAASLRPGPVEDAPELMLEGNGLPASVAASVKYQIGAQVTLDGNSVDLDQEKVLAAENAVQYEAAASFASQMIRMLTVAINGSGSPQSSGT
jgi:flagellar basal-body rod protein FlgB